MIINAFFWMDETVLILIIYWIKVVLVFWNIDGISFDIFHEGNMIWLIDSKSHNFLKFNIFYYFCDS